MTLSEKQIINCIKIDYPDFSIYKVEYAGEGCDSAAFLINDIYIFLFSKREESVLQLKILMKLLPVLHSHFTINIPTIEFASALNSSCSYIGYKKIEGEPLKKKYLNALPFDKKQSILKQIVQFLIELHSIALNIVQMPCIETVDFEQKYNSIYKDAIELVYPIVNDTTKKYVTKLFESYLSVSDNFLYIPSLLHADLSPGHILFDPHKKILTGIIDFADIQIGDPDYDFKCLFEDYGKQTAKELAELYYPNQSKTKLEKIDFFIRIESVIDILETLRANEKALEEINNLQKEAANWASWFRR